jgi:hypothetical protein
VAMAMPGCSYGTLTGCEGGKLRPGLQLCYGWGLGLKWLVALQFLLAQQWPPGRSIALGAAMGTRAAAVSRLGV